MMMVTRHATILPERLQATVPFDSVFACAPDADDFEEGSAGDPDDDGDSPADVELAELPGEGEDESAGEGDDDGFDDDPLDGASGAGRGRWRRGVGHRLHHAGKEGGRQGDTETRRGGDRETGE